MYVIKLKNGLRFFYTLKEALIFKKKLELQNIQAVILQRLGDENGYIRFVPIAID